MKNARYNYRIKTDFQVTSVQFYNEKLLMVEPKNLVHKQNKIVDDICSSLINGKISYASAGMVDNNVVYSAFSHKKWQETYQNCSLHYYDPSFLGALQISSIPLFWDAVPIITKKAAGIMQQRCEYTRVSSGVTISFKDKTRFLLLTLGSKLNSIDFMEYMNEDVFGNLNVREILWQKLG